MRMFTTLLLLSALPLAACAELDDPVMDKAPSNHTYTYYDDQGRRHTVTERVEEPEPLSKGERNTVMAVTAGVVGLAVLAGALAPDEPAPAAVSYPPPYTPLPH